MNKPGWIRQLAERARMAPSQARLLQQVADQAAADFSHDGDAKSWKDERSALKHFADRARDREREALKRVDDLRNGDASDVMIGVAEAAWRQAQVHGERAKAAEDALALIDGAKKKTLRTIAKKLPRRSDLPPLGREEPPNHQHQPQPWPNDPWAFNPFAMSQPPMFRWPPPMPVFHPFVPPMPPFVQPFMMPMGMMPMPPPPIWPVMPFGMWM